MHTKLINAQHYLREELYELIKNDASIFDFIQESSLDGIWYWDMENPEEEWMSSRFWTTLGYDPNEMPHKASAWQDIINKDDLAKAYELVQQHCIDPSIPYKQIIRYQHKNGSTVWIKCRGIAIRDKNGKPIRMLGAHHDVTELKNAELKILASKSETEKNEKRYRDLLFHLDAGIVVHNEKTLIQDCNAKACELLGLTEDQMKGKTAIDPQWQFYNEQNEVMPLSDYPVNLIISNKNALKDYIVGVYRPLTKDKVWLYVNGFAVFNEQHEIAEVIISFVDFTAKKLTEEKLIIAKERAEGSDRLKTAFLQNMSHEIRTPLNAIVGFSKILAETTQNNDGIKEFASIIQNSSNQLLGIVNDILTMSSLQTNQEKLNLENVNVELMLLELKAIFSAQNQNTELNFKFIENPSNKHLEITADRTKLVQVISNLLSNALKFTAKGSILFGYQLIEKNIQFFVKDTGIGIKENDQTKIFDRFIQGDLSTTKKYGGSGLGLSISKGFIELMGGKIWVESSFGVGSTFYFTIPLPTIQ